MSLTDWLKEKSADELVDFVKQEGYTHVCFLPVAEYLNEEMNGYSTLGYFAVTHRTGGSDAFKSWLMTAITPELA